MEELIERKGGKMGGKKNKMGKDLYRWMIDDRRKER